MDLKEIDIEYKQKLILREIETGNRQAIVNLLREIPDHITPEIVNKLADYLNPDRKPIKSGPKPRKKRLWVFEHMVISFYFFLCEDPTVNRDLQFFDDDEQYSLQTRADIKKLVCKVYGINARTFDDLLSKYNKYKKK